MMGVRLIREVLDHAPADMDPAERLVLVVIAENASDTTRRGWPGMDLITHRTGLTPDGVKKVFRRLAERGMEVRVPLGKDKNGRTFYAARGRQSNYLIPPFDTTHRPVKGRPRAPLPLQEKPGPQTPLSDEKGETLVPERGDAGPPLLLIEPSKNLGGRSYSDTHDRGREPPPPQCPTHEEQGNPDDEPCGACGTARRRRERWDRNDAERRRTQPQCRTHRGQPAHNCGLCRADALADPDAP